MNTNPTSKYLSELLGTFLLVFCGCGSAIFAAPQIGFLGVSFAFGLTLLFLIYSIGPVSGCHVNPAVTLCLALANKFPKKDVLFYIVSQFAGAILGGLTLYLIASGKAGFDVSHGFATNGFGEHSPMGYSLLACCVTEIVCTTILLYAILCSTSSLSANGFAGLYIGISLVVIHLVCIPVTNASVNFARSLGVAVVEGGWALEQLWIFALTNVISAILANVLFKFTTNNK